MKKRGKPVRSIKKVLRRIRSKISRKPLKIKEIEKRHDFSAPNLLEFYGDNRIVLLAKDPWWLFAYWEVTAGRRKEVLEMIRDQRLSPEKTVLRVYDAMDTSFSRRLSFFDIELNFIATNWYIDVGFPNHPWVVELGIRTREGFFFALVKSNTVRTPRFGVSDVLDEEWMMPDDLFWKLFGLSGGFAGQKSSLAVVEFTTPAPL